MNKTSIVLIIAAILPLNIAAQNNQVKQAMLTRFTLQSSALIPSSGEEISAVSYRSNVYWFPVTDLLQSFPGWLPTVFILTPTRE